MKGSLIRGIIAIVSLVWVIALASCTVPQAPLPGDTGTSTTTQSSTLGVSVGKPKAVAQTFQGCPASGDGGDPVLNTLKNRIDEGVWQPATVASLLALTWPSAIEQHPRSSWSAADKAEIAKHEGTPVQVEGYIASAKRQSPESCNCHSKNSVDFHVWLVDDPSKGRDQSVVFEVTPRVGVYHPAWTVGKLQSIASNHQKVRISGWLMMDPEHPDQIGKTRGTIWEIHPAMQIETQSGGQWKPLDNGDTGVHSESSAPQTAVPITPVSTATLPSSTDTQAQDNRVVQITDVFFNGVKGSSEPDEYVEITNTGAQPVDITDWRLQDDKNKHHFKWESYTMQPGQTIRVYTNEVHPESGGFSFGSGQAIWGNSGDVASLYDSDGQLVSKFGYGNKK